MQNQVDVITEKLGKSKVCLALRHIGDGGVQYLCNRQTGVQYLYHRDTYKVKEMSLGWNNITSIGILHFSKVVWGSLIILSLHDNNIGMRGCQYLSRATINHLQQLNLHSNSIESAGLLHLIKAQWKNLKEIYLYLNNICCDGIGSITKTHWKQLDKIDLRANMLTIFESMKIVLLEMVINQLDLDKNLIKQGELLTITRFLKKKTTKISNEQ